MPFSITKEPSTTSPALGVIRFDTLASVIHIVNLMTKIERILGVSQNQSEL
jgi:hypothetical protein